MMELDVVTHNVLQFGLFMLESAVNILFLAPILTFYTLKLLENFAKFIHFQFYMLVLQLPLHFLKIQLRKKKEKTQFSIKRKFIKDELKGLFNQYC